MIYIFDTDESEERKKGRKKKTKKEKKRTEEKIITNDIFLVELVHANFVLLHDLYLLNTSMDNLKK